MTKKGSLDQNGKQTALSSMNKRKQGTNELRRSIYWCLYSRGNNKSTGFLWPRLETPYFSRASRSTIDCCKAPPSLPPREPPAWWIAEQQNEAPPDLSILLRSKTGLFILPLPPPPPTSAPHPLFCQTQEMYVPVVSFAILEILGFRDATEFGPFWKKKKPLGRRSYEGSLWQRNEVKRRHTESFESEWPDRKSASGRAHRGCSFGLKKHRTRGHWQFSTSLLLQWSGSSV